MSQPIHGRADYLDLGNWNAVCRQCGRKRKASGLKLHWTGGFVCPEHWEARHPQDFVRTPPDDQTPPWTQPMPTPIFINLCTLNGSSAITQYATAGCVVAGFISPSFDPNLAPGE